MLSYFMRYDHTNYAGWGSGNVSAMHQLPEEVKTEYEAGNLVTKPSNLKFSQVNPVQSQEWLNGTGKKAGEIVRIKKTSALSMWALSYNMRYHIASETRLVFDTDIVTHNDCNKRKEKAGRDK